MWYTYIILFIFSITLVWCYKGYALKKNILDNPNERSSHVIPTPRGGGIVFPILWIAYLLVIYFFGFIGDQYLLIFIPSVIALAIIGFLDDCFNISAKWRFLTQLIAAIYSLWLLGGFSIIQVGMWSLTLGYVGFIIAVLMLIWSTNLYNFMDGIDGIAAIEALFVFGCGGYFIWDAGGYELARLIWAMAIIVAGFLVWNRPHAKIFMGDVGSSLLGFLTILFGVIGEVKYKVPLLLWVILYGVFWFDATVTLVRRILHGDVWYQAHRLHAYQRLQLKNFSHKKILLAIIIVNVLLVILAFAAYYFTWLAAIAFMSALLVLLCGYLLVEKIQPMYGSK